MAPTMTMSGSVLVRAGTNVFATFTTEIDTFIEHAEAYLTNLVKYDLVTNWTSLNAVYKKLFIEYVERMAAIDAIAYDMSGYTDGIEAENMIKIHWQRILDIEALLKDASVQDFAGA